MSDEVTSQSINESTESSDANAWDRFWFFEGSVQAAARLRAMICLVAALYFFSCWSDIGMWLVGDAPFSTERTVTFLRSAGLDSDARWMISPLFLIDSLIGGSIVVYRGYLLLGIALCVVVAAGRGGKLAPWVLWLVFIGWANRLVLLAGVTETLLSLGLFATAFAPPGRLVGPDRRDWTAGFALRLTAVQITLFATCTIATMLAGNVWWNGTGAYALVAPVQDRTLPLGGAESYFTLPLIYESLTHLLVLALPIGLLAAWIRPQSWAGPAIVIVWCAGVATLGSHWLYGLSFACMTLAIRHARDE